MSKKPFYIIWGNYYNPVIDAYTEKMLGCYQNKSNAERMANNLHTKFNNGTFYVVKEEYFCDNGE